MFGIGKTRVSIFHEFVPPPWGGGNQFLLALRQELRARGFKVEANEVSSSTKACLFNSYNFDIECLKRVHRNTCRIVHRVDGPLGVYRGKDDGTDLKIWSLNQEFADATIFQSNYSLQKHIELGMAFKSPHVVMNAVDPRIFNTNSKLPFDRNRKTRLITTSWSDNPNKGFGVYRQLEELLDWDKYEYTLIGRSPIEFTKLNVIGPLPSKELAKHLRDSDVFMTASLHESCSNAAIEALACGLPVVYVKSGSLPEIVKQAGFGFDSAEEVPALLDKLVEEYEARQGQIMVPSLKEVGDRYLEIMGLGTGEHN